MPWDPTSEKHYERMLLQRRSCGWAEDEVPAWKTESLAGRKFMFWLVSEAHPRTAWATLLDQSENMKGAPGILFYPDLFRLITRDADSSGGCRWQRRDLEETLGRRRKCRYI